MQIVPASDHYMKFGRHMMRIALPLMALIGAILIPNTAQAQSRVAGANGWLLPVACNTLSSDEHMHLKRGSVNAWDITCPRGSPIYPMAPGIVTYAGCNNDGGYGCWTLIDHQNGFSSIYAHMIQGSIQVRRGQQVDAWTVLGAVGWTGKTDFGPHVHWEIRHSQAGRQRIDRYFNLAQMDKCDFCAATGKPRAATGVAGSEQVSAGLSLNWLLAVLLTLLVVYILYSPRNNFAWATHHAMGLMVLVLLVVGFSSGWFTGASMPTARAATGDTWRVAYAFMRQWEGSGCVYDPVRTNAGVTQGTYDAYRMSRGLGPANVCTSLTDAQAEQIYYERYWLKSGANKLPHSVAITHFDFAVNAGPGRALAALQVCGQDTHCYNNYREQFYRSLSSFSIYGRGWLNRLNHIRQLTERI